MTRLAFRSQGRAVHLLLPSEAVACGMRISAVVGGKHPLRGSLTVDPAAVTCAGCVRACMRHASVMLAALRIDEVPPELRAVAMRAHGFELGRRAAWRVRKAAKAVAP